MKIKTILIPSLTILLGAPALFAAHESNPFLGRWALTIPGNRAGWLGIAEKDGKLQAEILWGGGSVVPVTTAAVNGDELLLTRVQTVERKDANGKTNKVDLTETITAHAAGSELKLVTTQVNLEGRTNTASFTGQRIAELPPAPDLARVHFGKAVTLFNGKDLTGWRLVNPQAVNGWSVEHGALVNRPTQEEGKPHKFYGNLRTEAEFSDFRLTLETRLSKDSNSGVYLRGIYEVQVFDSYGKPVDSHNMGAIYSRITPLLAAEKPVGEWQTLDITLVDRHVTVILNGKTIIDNQPLLGCTGGALWSDELRPGPIYLQGDHSLIDFRNIVLHPVEKL
ncbi:MAG: DUF1080 domain-containing protein [Verrucomicrobiota bacterium]